MNAARSLLAAVLAGAATAHAADGTRVYAFTALLDDKPIGEHRFTVVTEGTTRRVTSDAAFSVRFLGFEAYRYRHHATEQWAGDCLAGLQSTTDDDGKPASVKLVKTDDVNRIGTAKGGQTVEGCLMTYAYWNPALRTQTRLLNPQNGQVDAVKVERVATGRIAVAGKEVEAEDWRITGGDSPVDVWLTPQGEWVGIDSMVAKGKHKLTYRLR